MTPAEYLALADQVARLPGQGQAERAIATALRAAAEQAERLEMVEKALTHVRSAIRRTPGHRGVQFSGKDVDMIDAALRGEVTLQALRVLAKEEQRRVRLPWIPRPTSPPQEGT